MIEEKQHNINIEKFADFSLTFTLTDSAGEAIDLTGATITAAIREFPESSDYTEFNIETGDTSGVITISMTNETTTEIGWTYGYYDVFVTFADGIVWRVLWGRVNVIPAVTRTDCGTVCSVLSYPSFEDFPTAGRINRLYLDRKDYHIYFWDGSVYCVIYTGQVQPIVIAQEGGADEADNS